MTFFITKDMVLEALKQGGVLEVGPDTVMTPLARDTAARLGVSVRTAGTPRRRPLAAANWKMNHGAEATVSFLQRFITLSSGLTDVEMLICPSHPFLILAGELLRNSPVRLGAQDVAWETGGAYTGEVSASMIDQCGCTYVIVGHSERRRYHEAENGWVPAKLKQVLAASLKPILCVGEVLADRDHGRTYLILKRQLDEAFASIGAGQAVEATIAYEPVWAIGTGRVATPTQVADAHAYIRKTMSSRYSVETAARCRILYGGSVNAGNAASLAEIDDVDGFLVGGASLEPDSFYAIAEILNKART